MSDRTLTAELLARLQRHYIKPGELMPGGMFLPEVTLGTRRADALYVGFFASRGKLLVGHELKVSRADWLHELDDPSKAETWAKHCHAWYLVVPSASIVQPGELPHGWGLMVPSTRTKTRMDVVVVADLHSDRQPSWEATHALVQRADSLRMDGVLAAREKARQDMHVEVEKAVELRLAQRPENFAEQRAERAEALLAEVSDILGLRITAGRAYEASEVSIEELRSSFAAWVAADRQTARSLDYRTGAIENVMRALTEASTALEEIKARAGVST